MGVPEEVKGGEESAGIIEVRRRDERRRVVRAEGDADRRPGDVAIDRDGLEDRRMAEVEGEAARAIGRAGSRPRPELICLGRRGEQEDGEREER